ncbi:MAG TPA: HAMP domain-containing sensor histidine kinase [Solirubrobacteraceae bacterium]|jgi:two-component system sensor histidine kinase MprB|nr:HAMP domain-containing sensor histidine kinase [Solirubrobacteraceae bacterium]
MSFRRRMVLLAAGAVAAAVVLASVVVYVVTRNDLLGQTDASLREKLIPGQAQSVQIRTERLSASAFAKLQREGRLPPTGVAQGGTFRSSVEAAGSAGATVQAAGAESATVVAPGSASAQARPNGGLGELARLVLPPPKLGGATGYVQLFQPDGQVLRSERNPGAMLPVTAATRAVAAGRRDAFFSDATVAGTRVRVLTERAPGNGVWQVALPLTDVDNTLANLQLVLAIVSLGGIALAAALGLLVSRAALVPVRRLTGAAESVARTQDLGHRIETGETDELGRLAASFNTMLAALERSRLAQRQLVSDASHELRTPLTSVQANLDALALGQRLPADERARIVAAAQAQLRELTVLVGDLVDLSKTDVEEIEVEDVRLDLAAASALERARLHGVGGHSSTFVLEAQPCLVRAAPARLERAIANLLDNACKWNPPTAPAAPIEVRVRDGRLEVRDHGPGIPAEDLPRVFDRFYRAPAARARPGSGLGLAIVRQMAETHGGSVHAANDPGGGARLTLELPPLAMTDAELVAATPGDPAGSAATPGGAAGEVAVQETPRLL